MSRQEQQFQTGDKVLVTERIRPCNECYEFLIGRTYTVSGVVLHHDRYYYKFRENPTGNRSFAILEHCLELVDETPVPSEILADSFCDLIFGGD